MIASTLEPERTQKTLMEAGAEAFVELYPLAEGIMVERYDDSREYVAVTRE